MFGEVVGSGTNGNGNTTQNNRYGTVAGKQYRKKWSSTQRETGRIVVRGTPATENAKEIVGMPISDRHGMAGVRREPGNARERG